MKFLAFILTFFSLHSFATDSSDWTLQLESISNKEDKKIIDEYSKSKYSKEEKIIALITKTSQPAKEIIEKNLLFKDIDLEIDNNNLIKDEKNILKVEEQPYLMILKRDKNKITGTFNIQIKDKTILNQLKKDRFSLFNFSKDFISGYFCSIPSFNLWMKLNNEINITYIINQKKENIIYDLEPQINHCD